MLYREDQKSDFGLPRKILLSIKPVLYHPVFIWIHKNLHHTELLEQNRKRIIRYLLLSYITVDNTGKASKQAISVIKETKYSFFPDKEIHDTLVAEELSIPIPDPNSFALPFKSECDGFFRHRQDMFHIADDKYSAFRSHFWHKKELLLWYQREYASKWFAGYNPMSNDAYDTPYDYDHILPYSHLINSGQTNSLDATDTNLVNKFTWNRSLYLNSLDNFRIWPGWANKSDNNSCQTKS